MPQTAKPWLLFAILSFIVGTSASAEPLNLVEKTHSETWTLNGKVYREIKWTIEPKVNVFNSNTSVNIDFYHKYIIYEFAGVAGEIRFAGIEFPKVTVDLRLSNGKILKPEQLLAGEGDKIVAVRAHFVTKDGDKGLRREWDEFWAVSPDGSSDESADEAERLRFPAFEAALQKGSSAFEEALQKGAPKPNSDGPSLDTMGPENLDNNTANLDAGAPSLDEGAPNLDAAESLDPSSTLD